MSESQICLFSPIKNAGRWLKKSLVELDKLPKMKTVFIYGQSNDDTLDVMRKWKEKTHHDVEVYSENTAPYKPHGSAEIAFVYEQFRGIYEKTDCDYVLMWDCDLSHMPENMITRLLKMDTDIAAPYPYVHMHTDPCEMFYDTFVFRKDGYRFHPYNPPVNSENNKKPFELDSVGCVFLTTRECFLESEYRDPYAHLNFCNDSREKGFKVMADPKLKIYHVDLIRFGEYHQMVEYIPTSKHYNPSYRPPPMITDKGTIVQDSELEEDLLQVYLHGKPVTR